MGVTGLTTFIDNHPRLLTDLSLCNTKLIIDGNNLYHFLYYYFKVPYQYGGDYNTYHSKIKYFFKCLERCKIEPLVIFDGGYDASDSKLKTIFKRIKDRIHLAGFLSRGGRGKILPILAHEVFMDTLNELKVKHWNCNYEADEEIAALANRHMCPVLSNDSDFFIFEMDVGVVLLDYLDLTVHESNIADDKIDACLKVQLFNSKSWQNLFPSIDKETLALAASLLGNDHIDKELLIPFYNNMNFEKRRYKQHSRTVSKVYILLKWIEKFKSVPNAMNEILTFYPSAKRSKIEQMILNNIDRYTNLKTSIVDDNSVNVIYSNEEMFDYHSKKIPQWFQEKIVHGELSVFFLNASRLHRVYLLCQIENLNEISSYNSAIPIRKIIYEILQNCNVLPTSESNLERWNLIEEYDRKKKYLIINRYEKDQSLSQDLDIPNLYDIPELSPEMRSCIYFSVISNINERFCEFDGKFKFLASVIYYWGHNAQPKLNESHILSILLCYLNLNFCENFNEVDVDSFEYPNDCGMLNSACFSQCDINIWTKIKSNLTRFSQQPIHNNRTSFNIDTIHAFSQFQACYQAALYLNAILLQPLQTPYFFNVFNGTFLYNMYHQLVAKADPISYIAEILVKSSIVSEHFLMVVSGIKEKLSETLMNKENSYRMKRKKKKSKKICEKTDTDLSESSEKDDLTDGIEMNCEISNKFACLL